MYLMAITIIVVIVIIGVVVLGITYKISRLI